MLNLKNTPSGKKVLLAAGALLLASLLSFKDDFFQASKNLEIFATLYKEINVNYVDEINASKMMKNGIDAMLQTLDPYTEYVPETEMDDYKLKYVSTHYGGIGTSIQSRNGDFIIAEIFEGFPAHKAKLQAGDKIVKINGVSLKGKAYDEVSAMLKGPRNTTLKLEVERPGTQQALNFDLVRGEIVQPNVSYAGMLPNNIAYIKLDKFLENSANEVRDAALELLKKKPGGLILDLRSNGGGILQEAVKIVGLFVPPNTNVVTQKGRSFERTYTYSTRNAPLVPQLPLAVLINGRSASASEIVAGALQDIDRAVVVGQRSFGKGLVQQSFKLPYNSLVKVTVAKYYTPSGRCIQALDYAHRKDDGRVGKIADSAITAYKTTAGRTVYDGSGIYPDLLISGRRFSPLTEMLVNRYYIFDYATQFKNSHPNIPGAQSFKLSDAQYADFVKYLADKNCEYNTASSRLLNELKLQAEKEKKLEEISSELEALSSKMKSSKDDDLAQFKGEIAQILENEISSRYFYQKGRIEQTFKYDPDLRAAIEVLGNRMKLAAILKGEGSYKSIGNPLASLNQAAETNE